MVSTQNIIKICSEFVENMMSNPDKKGNINEKADNEGNRESSQAYRRKTQRANLPPPPPPPCDSNDNPIVPENAETTESASVFPHQKSKPSVPEKPLLTTERESPHSGDETRNRINGSPKAPPKLRHGACDAKPVGVGSNPGGNSTAVGGGRSSGGRIPKPSPRHSLLLEKNAELSTADKAAPRPSPRAIAGMDNKPKSARPVTKPAPPPQENKPRYQGPSNVILKQRFLDTYGNGSATKPSSNQQSVVARSVSALSSATGAQLRTKQGGSNKTENMSNTAMKERRESTMLNRQSVQGTAGPRLGRRSSAMTTRDSESGTRHAALSKVPSAAEMRESMHRDQAVIADFLGQLKVELGTDGSVPGSTRSSNSSSTTDETFGSKEEALNVDISADSKLKRGNSKSSDAPDGKVKRHGSKDKKDHKVPKSKSKFYTSDEDDRDSIVSRTSVVSTGSSTFYITEEREEIVEEVKDNQTVSSRTVSHQKSTLCATRNLFEKNSTSNITKKFEDLTPKDLKKRAGNERTGSPKASCSPPKSSLMPPRKIFGASPNKTAATEHSDSKTKSSPANSKQASDAEISLANSAIKSSPALPKKIRDKETRISPPSSREQSPVAPVRKSKLARKQTSPEKKKVDLKQSIKAESGPPGSVAHDVTKPAPGQVASQESGDKDTNGQGDGVVRRNGAVMTHRRKKSLMSFTAEDMDIFQRKSTEYLLEDTAAVDMTVSTSSTDSTASTPRISRRDFPGLSGPTASEKRRSRSLEPMQSPWGVRLKPSRRPTAAAPQIPEKPPKPCPPVLRKLNKTPPKPPPKVTHLSPHANTTDVYCDATSKRFENSKTDTRQKKDTAAEYDNNFDFAQRGRKNDAVMADHKRKSRSLPVTGAPEVSNGVIPGSEDHPYEEYEFQKNVPEDGSPLVIEKNRTGNSPLAELSLTPIPLDRSNNASERLDSLNASNLLDDSGDTLVNSSHRSSTSSDSSFGDSRRPLHHVYADIDDAISKRLVSTSSEQSENAYECIDLAESAKHKDHKQQISNETSPKRQELVSKTVAVNLSEQFSKSQKEESAVSETKVTRKVSRKLSRKLTRKLSRKLTKKYGKTEKFEKLKKLLQEYEDESVDDGEAEPLEFSDSESDWGDWDDDSFTDESDLEFEQELLSKLSQDDRTALEDDGTTTQAMSKTQKVATELLATERSYVQKLHLIDQVFHNQIMMENRQVKMFPNDVIPQMFSNVKSIYQFHNDFLLPQLEKRMQEWASCEKIGDVMCKYAPFLKIYTEYVQNFDTAMQTINSWREKSPTFAALLQKLQELPECDKLTLQHHMLCPIQRVPRYELLLKEYLKHLAEDSEDREETKKALEMVTTAALTSNNIMQSNDKFKKLVEVNDKLGGALDLVSPTRELIKEGRIIKLAARNGMHQERYIFLFNDVFLLCQSVPVSLKQQYKVSYKLSIDGMQIQDGDNLETPNTFYVKNKQKILELHCETEEEKMTWQIALWNVISDYLKKKQTRGQGHDLSKEFSYDVEPGKTPPKWIKDQETSQCMLCGTTFTVLKRRHHCRGCGKVVCGKCSSFKAKLEYDGGEKLNRVCSRCYAYMEKKGNVEISGPTLVSAPAIRSRRVLQVKASEGAVHAGYMNMSLDKKTWTRRWFAVRKDYVLYSFKAHQDVVAITSMPLPGYVVQKAGGEDNIPDKEHVLKLWHQGQRKIYYFHVDNKDNLEKWQTVLEYVVQAELPPDFVDRDKEEAEGESKA